MDISLREKLLTLVSRVCLVEALICVLSAVGTIWCCRHSKCGGEGIWRLLSNCVFCYLWKKRRRAGCKSCFLILSSTFVHSCSFTPTHCFVPMIQLYFTEHLFSC